MQSGDPVELGSFGVDVLHVEDIFEQNSRHTPALLLTQFQNMKITEGRTRLLKNVTKFEELKLKRTLPTMKRNTATRYSRLVI